MHHVRSILNKTTALLLMVALLAGSFPPVTTNAAAAQIRQEINILTGEPMTSPGTLSSQARVLLDTTAYSGTKTYYFEVVHSGAASNTGTIKLSRAGTSTYDASIAGATSTSTTLTRSAAFTPPAGQTEYTVTLVGDGVRSQTVKSARIIVIQNSDPITATQTQVEIGNYQIGRSNIVDEPLAAPKYWKYDAAKWNGDISATAEVTWQKTNNAVGSIPTYQAKGAFASGAAALTVAVPTGLQDGDLMLLFVESANQAITTPSGWTQVTNSPQFTGTAAAAGGVRLGVFYRVVSGAQSSVTVADTGDHQTAIIMSFRGVDTTNPINISAGSVQATAGTAATFPSVTTTSQNTLIVLAAALDTDANSTAAMGAVTNANLANITERHDQVVNTGVGGGLTITTGEEATAGSIGTSTATGSTSVTRAYLTLALTPAPPATTFLAKLQESDGTGDGFTGWTDKITIANNLSTNATTTRTRSASFTPLNGRNYRLVTDLSDTNATYGTYNAKIIINSSSIEEGNLSTASYANKSFSVSGQETLSRGLAFSADGTKMYAVGTVNNTVYQYTLSTAWDVSTASYANKSFSVSGQDIGPRNIFLDNSGTNMYVVGNSNDTVYQYTLSTAWDVSTASYANKSFSVSGQESAPQSFFLNNSGTNMYVVGNSNNTVYQYTLSTAWDVSTASYANKSFLASAQISGGIGLNLNSSGTKMYILGFNNDTVYQYTLSTAWDVSTASYANKSFSVSGQESAPHAIVFNSDLTNMFTVGTSTNTVYSYTLTAPVTSITNLEPQYLLANTSLAAGTSLQNFLTKWDASEWSGVTTGFSHTVDTANGSSSVIEVNTAGGVQVVNSVVSNPDNQGISATPFSVSTTKTLATGEDVITGLVEDTNYVYASLSTGPAKIIRISKSDFTTTTTKTLATGEDSASSITQDDTYLYITTYTSPAKIVRLLKSDFTTTTTKTLATGENLGRSIANDATYVYVALETSPGKIVRLLKSDFTTTTTKTLATGENAPLGITEDGTYVYTFSFTSPAKIIRLLKSDFTTTTTKTLATGEDLPRSIINDTNYLYMGLDTVPGKIVRLLKSDFTTTTTKTLATGENTTYSLDQDDTYVYAGMATTPGKIIRLLKSDFTTTTTKTLATGENDIYGIAEDTDYVYGGLYTYSGKLIRLQKSGNYMTMPTNGNLDVKATTNNTDIYGSRILVAVSQATTSSYEQSGFRFFGNANSTNVGSPLAALNTSATLSNSNDQFRLRMTLHVSGAALDTTGQNFKLQYAARSGTCDTSFSGETYADVTATTPIAYYENFDATHGATLTTNANDPTHGGDTVVAQSYVETNNFTNPSAIAVGQDGKWDFALHDRGTTSSAVYCLRVVKSDGSTLNTYTYIPQVTTAIYTPRGGGGGNAGGESSGGGTPTGGGTGQGGGSGSEGSGGGTPTGGGTGSGGGGGDVGFLIPSSWFAQDSFFALITSLFARR